MRKIIFLDVDGVLNSVTFFRKLKDNGTWGLTEVDMDAVSLLKRVQAQTDAEIVLSSTWRLVPELVKTLVAKSGLAFVSQTPFIGQKHRGAEIESWLDDHDGVDRFVILDDDADAGQGNRVEKHFVQTDFTVGLTEENARQMLTHLNA